MVYSHKNPIIMLVWDSVFSIFERSGKGVLMASKILLTGFEPFGANRCNPSSEAVKKLPELNGKEIKKLILPVTWSGAFAALLFAWREFEPDAVLMPGLAGGSDRIRIERVGINLCGAVKDNLGKYPDGTELGALERKIADDGPAAYFTTYNSSAILHALQNAGIPAGFSFSAGTYLCNYVLYSSLDKIARESKDIKAGFLHVPYAEKERENAPFLPLDTIVSALELALSNMF